MTTCYDYGSISGCDEFCPVLLAGNCEEYKDAVEVCDFDDEELEEVMSLYRHKEEPEEPYTSIW